jgi:RNA polymerase sigma factor (sigma-70 family)
MSDDFVRRLKEDDDEEAWSDLRNRLIRMARALVARAAPSLDAEDIVDESLLRVRRSLSSFEGRSHVTTWVFGICQNVCREMLREGAREVQADMEAALEEKGGGRESDNPLRALLGDELVEIVRECLKEASPGDRELLTLAYWEDLRFATIAEQRRTSEGAVKTAMHRARERIARCVARKQGYEDLLPRADG